MTSSVTTYPDWKAPAEDGQMLIWPEPRQVLADTLENQKLLSSSAARVQGVALAEIRRGQREWIGHRDDAQPIIASGHQTELYHPGVWVKDALLHAAAAKIGGQGYHFAVDTDAPKHLALRWPGGAEPITDDPHLKTAHWSGLLDSPTPRHVALLEKRLADAKFPYESAAVEFLRSLRRLAMEEPKLPAALTNACHAMDWELGLRHHAMLTSPIWSSPPYLVFAHHVIATARRFASDYNAALAEYRREKKVRTPSRPMPDLAAFEDSTELPFWLDDLANERRDRPTAFAGERGFVVTSPGGDEFTFDESADGWDAAARLGEWLSRNQLRLSPRALTLTMFLRLFVVDQFVHGIGGGQYDQVTDRIIATHFGFPPPKFSVTTATLYLPQAAAQPRVCAPCVVHEGHRLKHSLLGERKNEYVRRIESAPRCSPERYETFMEMHRELNTAMLEHPAMRRWEQELRETRQREIEEATLYDRELFYALQPRERLVDLIGRYNDAFRS